MEFEEDMHAIFRKGKIKFEKEKLVFNDGKIKFQEEVEKFKQEAEKQNEISEKATDEKVVNSNNNDSKKVVSVKEQFTESKSSTSSIVQLNQIITIIRSGYCTD